MTTIGGTLGVTGVLTATSLDISGDIDVDGTTNLDVVDIDGAVDMASTLAVAGVVTANAGVVVDNFTLDGTTLALSSGDMTLDIAGELIIDTDLQGEGNGILLKDDGTTYGNIFRTGSDLIIMSVASDEDLLFKGNDNGSTITALTLDMSDAGSAIFNNAIYLNADLIHTGDTDTQFQFSGANEMRLIAGNVETFKTTATEVSVNDQGATNVDFRVESDNKTHMFFVDSSSDYIAIGTGDQNNGGLLNLNAVSGSTTLTMTTRSTTDAHTNIFSMLKTPATSGNYTATASGDILGDIRFYGVNTSTVADIGARIQVEQTGTSGSTVPSKMIFMTNEATAMTINSSQHLLIGKTADDNTTTGTAIHDNGFMSIARSGNIAMLLERSASSGDILRFTSGGTTVGNINSREGVTSAIVFDPRTNGSGLSGATLQIQPTNAGGGVQDNIIALGSGTTRFDDAFITNGVTTGSDRNEKQDIAALTSAEMLVAARISQTFHTYRWKDAVADKGDNARIHTGTIAQEVQAAFAAEGLDVSRYAMFMSDTWWEHDVDVAAVEADDIVVPPIEAADAYTRTDTYDTEDEAPSGSTSKTRLGIRYPELLSFLAAYNEQRFAAIETRLTALEG